MVEGWSKTHPKRLHGLLQFATGSRRVPVGGYADAAAVDLRDHAARFHATTLRGAARLQRVGLERVRNGPSVGGSFAARWARRTTTPRSATGSRRFRRPTRRTRTQMSTCRRSRTRRTSLRPERPARGLRDQQVKKPNTNLMCRPAQVGSARCLCLRDTRDVSRPLMAWIVRHDRAMMNMLAC